MQQINIRCTGSTYAVRIGPALLGDLGRETLATARGRKAVVITDSNVAEAYLEPAMESLRGAGVAAASAIIPAGESSKTLQQAGRLIDAMLDAGMDRASAVVALGGGVVTDIGGFVAAMYMRGIPWVAASTTLLGQVDASVGGKTAVDHPRCKNLIGAFHQPAAVLADVQTLATLPEEEFRTGLAEVVKHGVIRDSALFAMLEDQADAILAREGEVLEDVVARNVRIKADVVMADEREGGLRRILNYGHTVGHALESMAMCRGGQLGGQALTHGRAVALGMMAEAHIALARGIVDAETVRRQEAILERFGLPVRLPPGVDAGEFLALIHYDKKAEAGRLRFVLPRAIGDVTEADDVTDTEVLDALASLG